MKLFQRGMLHVPDGIAVDTTGKIAISYLKGHCVDIFDKEGNCLRTIGSHGENAGEFDHPWGVTYF